MDALITSTLVVALAEIGDKTQLLAILLASRYRAPLAISAGILVATLANHALAALLGAQVAGLLDGAWFRYAVAASFIAMAAWALVPDSLGDDPDAVRPGRFGPFLATVIAFFLVEMGDKTQIATIALGARYESVLWVTAGTTIGMMVANIPAVLLGERVLRVVPLRTVRIGTAVLFLGLGLWALVEATRVG